LQKRNVDSGGEAYTNLLCAVVLALLFLDLVIQYSFIFFAKKTKMKCPKCKSESHVRNDLIKGRQRFKCKGCGCNCTAGYGQVLEKEKNAGSDYPCILKV
jgi:transposase-like protein